MEALTEREHAYFGPRTDKEPGSVAWCWQTIALMQTRWKQKELDEAGFDALVKELTQHKAWEVVPPEQPYGSLKMLIQAEIGCSEEEIRRRLIAHAHPKRGPQEEGNSSLSTYSCKLHESDLTQLERAQKNGISVRQQAKLDYLADDKYADLLYEVQIGTMKIDAAYKRATGKAYETRLEKMKRAWDQLTPEEKRQFPYEVVTDEQDREMLTTELAKMRAHG